MFFRATTSHVLYQRHLDKRSGSHISPLLPKNHFYWSYHIELKPKSKLHLSTAPRPLNILRTIGNITPLVNHKTLLKRCGIWNLAFRRHQIPPFRKKMFCQNRGGRDCLDHLLSSEELVCVCCAWPSKASLGETRGDRPRWSRRCREEKQCSPTWEKLGKPKKGWCAQYPARKVDPKKRPLQDGLKTRTKIV